MLRKILEWSALGLLTLGMFVGGTVLTVAGQGKDSQKVTVSGKTGTEGTVKFSTELPKEIKIPEVRTDKVLLFQEQGRNVQLEQQAAIERFRASEEWKALEVRQKLVLDKLEAELRSALSLAGVKEEDYAKYKYDQATLKFTLQAESKAEPKK